MELRLGELLVDGGVLSREQADRILETQARTGEPFGVLAERLFGVDPLAVEDAWARQYASMAGRIDPSDARCERSALELVTRRQAWQFRVLPMRFDDRFLAMATTLSHLRRALRFATNMLPCPVYLVLAEPEHLGVALCRHYPMPGMSPASVLDGSMDALLDAMR